MTIMINIDQTNVLIRDFFKDLRKELEDIYEDKFCEEIYEYLKLIILEKQMTIEDFENEIKEFMDNKQIPGFVKWVIEKCKFLNQSNQDPHYLVVNQASKTLGAKEEVNPINKNLEQPIKNYSINSKHAKDKDTNIDPSEDIISKKRKYSKIKDKNDSNSSKEEYKEPDFNKKGAKKRKHHDSNRRHSSFDDYNKNRNYNEEEIEKRENKNNKTNESKFNKQERDNNFQNIEKQSGDIPQKNNPVNPMEKKLRIKCKRWPICQNKQCLYFHPYKTCPFFPNCPRGNSCLFIHPNIPCKFGSSCNKSDCGFTHQRQDNVVQPLTALARIATAIVPLFSMIMTQNTMMRPPFFSIKKRNMKTIKRKSNILKYIRPSNILKGNPQKDQTTTKVENT